MLRVEQKKNKSPKKAVSSEKGVKIMKKRYVKVVAAGCFHWPLTIKKYFEKWIEFVQVFKPAKIYLTGSLFHSKRSLRTLKGDKMDDEITFLKKGLIEFREAILVRIRKAAPEAEIFYLEGSCEKNLRLWCEKQGLNFETEILGVLNLSDLKIEYVPEGKIRLGKFQFTHGKHIRQESVASAKAELKERGISGCSSISHHIGAHFRTDYRGQMAWYEIGGFCGDNVKEPFRRRSSPYSEQGFLIGWFHENGHHFIVTPIRLDGTIVQKRGRKKFIFFDPAIPQSKRHWIEIKVGCMHMPFTHKKSFLALLNLLRRLQPRRLHIVGDFMDFPELSKFKDARIPRIQASSRRNRVKAIKMLRQIREAIPNTYIDYEEGNHERRLKAYLLEKAAVFYDEPALTIPQLLNLSELNIRFIPSRGGRKEYEHLTIHGDYVRKHSGDTAKAELEAKGISGDSAHTHRLGKYCKTDEMGTREWNEIGCFAQYQIPGVDGNKANWQRGFAITIIDRTNSTRQVRTIIIPVIHGKIYFNGMEFTDKTNTPDKTELAKKK